MSATIEEGARATPLRLRAEKTLTAARKVLAGDTEIPARRRGRAAAVLARTALELAVDSALDEAGMPMLSAGMRVKLICLTVAKPDLMEAEIAWAGLSSACHQHAYELSPATAEVEHLVEVVARVLNAPHTPCNPSGTTPTPSRRR